MSLLSDVQIGWGPALALRVVGVLTVTLLGAYVLVYVYLFKMVSHMQSRLGPMEAGPHGLFQPVAEMLKYFQKEDLVPSAADRRVFRAAVFLAFGPPIVMLAAIPAGPHIAGFGLNTDILFVLAISSTSTLGVLMAGWGSANKYALLGGIRAAGQVIAYELPLILSVVGVVAEAGSMRLQTIVEHQATGSIFGWSGLGNPFILTQFVGFALFAIAAQAELGMTPFDMPLAESELVGGYLVEYSGLRYLLFFQAEITSAFAYAALGATLFLGGWALPGVSVSSGAMDIVGPAVLAVKILVLAFAIFVVRFTFPRLREDQLQALAWKYMIPIALVNLLMTGVLKVAF